jgi:O-antigen/teichoic acid export membrane protein
MHIFGKELIVGAIPLIVVSIGQVMNVSAGPVGYMNTMTGHPEYEFYNNIFLVIINIVLNLILIPVYGIMGAAIASAVSFTVSNIIKLLLLFKNTKIHPYNFDYIKLIISMILAYFMVFFLKNLIIFHWFFRLICFSFLFFCFFIIIYYLFGFSEEDKILIEAITKKIKR